eukprot:jgi/Botrbrau1/15661/Bobra.4_1s0045.1
MEEGRAAGGTIERRRRFPRRTSSEAGSPVSGAVLPSENQPTGRPRRLLQRSSQLRGRLTGSSSPSTRPCISRVPASRRRSYRARPPGGALPPTSAIRRITTREQCPARRALRERRARFRGPSARGYQPQIPGPAFRYWGPRRGNARGAISNPHGRRG